MAAQKASLNAESYSSRPDILNVEAKDLRWRGRWSDFKASHLSFVAELLEAYSADTHLYFIARDGELFYDIARLATWGTSDSVRIHLINVSSQSVYDSNLMPYLKQEGISAESLKTGKKVLFVDTGFTGTIPG